MFNLKEMKLILDPFPHFFVENFLNQDIFQDIKNNFPSREWFGDGKYGDGRTTSHTNRFNLSAGQYGETNFKHFIENENNVSWKKLYYEFSTVAFRSEVISKFGKELENSSFIKSEFAPITFDISYQTDGYVNPPHLDTPYHIFQAIVYISTEKIQKGGNITLWKNNKIAKDYKIKNNSCLIWMNCKDSFHAAYPELLGERELIYIGVDSKLSSCWANRGAPSSHEFNIKNAKSPWRIYDFSKNVFV